MSDCIDFNYGPADSPIGVNDKQCIRDTERDSNPTRDQIEHSPQARRTAASTQLDFSRDNQHAQECRGVGNGDRKVQKHEIRESNDQRQEIRESNDQRQEVRESNVGRREIKESNDQRQEIRESNDQRQEVRESNVGRREIKESNDQRQEVRESNVGRREIRESNDQRQEIRESNVGRREIKDSNDQRQEVKENIVQRQDVKESNDQRQEIRESNVGRREIKERNLQTHSKPGAGSSLPKKNGLVSGNGKRPNGQVKKLAKAPTSRTPYLTSPQTPAFPLMSSLFPASFAPSATFTPANENGQGGMNGSNQMLHKIRSQDPLLAHVSEHTVCATDSSQENQESSSKVLPKSYKQTKRRKQAVVSHDKAATMEMLTESSTFLNHPYYHTRHDLYPKLDSYHFHTLQGYSNYSVFPQIPNNYSWMVNQNGALQPSNIMNKTSVLEAPNFKTSPLSTQQKKLPKSSSGKHKQEKSTNGDNQKEEKPTEEIEDIKCTTAVKSEPCFSITKSNNVSPVETSSSYSPHFNSSAESMFEKSRISSPQAACKSKCEDNTSDSDVCETVAKKKKLSGDRNANAPWTSSPHSSVGVHKFHSPIPGSSHFLKLNSESPATILSLPSPVTPISTPPSWHLIPNGSEAALTPDLTLGNQYSFVQQPDVYNISTVGQVEAREKDVFYCHMCNYSGKSKIEYDAHMNAHFDFNCPHCDYTSRTEGRLNRHIKDFHSENSTRRNLSDRSKTYKCKNCAFSSTEREEFWKHYRTHIKEDKLLQCPQCPFVTEYKHHLEYHISNHFGSKPFKCGKCNYSCVNRSMLNSHMKSHTKVYPYRCSDCTYATKYSHSLKLHLKKHSHRSAMSLKLDGSFPKEVPAQNELPVGGKSQVSEEQLNLRNDTMNPYFSQMFAMANMPLGMQALTPEMNNMMSFWPMLHPTPMQAGMLADSLIFNHLMGVGAVNTVGSKMEYKSTDLTKPGKKKINSKMDIKNLVCTQCNLALKSTEALHHHIFLMHGDTTTETAEYSDTIAEMSRDKHRRSSSNQDLKNQLLHPHTASDDQQSKSHIKNSGSDICPSVNPDHRNNLRTQKAESPNSLPTSLPSHPNKSSQGNKLEDIHHIVTISDNKSEKIGVLINTAGTEQQVQLGIVHFEPKTASMKKILSNEQAVQEEKINFQSAGTDLKNNFDFQCSQNALDLSKQKSSIVFSHLDFPVNGDNANMKCGEEHSGNKIKCSANMKCEEEHSGNEMKSPPNKKCEEEHSGNEMKCPLNKKCEDENSGNEMKCPLNMKSEEEHSGNEMKCPLNMKCEEEHSGNEMKCPLNMKCEEEHSGNKMKSPPNAALLPHPHTISEDENIIVNSHASVDEKTMPRKRSRKGIAYRLDITRLKRCKMMSDSLCNEAELAFDQDRAKKSTGKKVDETNVAEIQGYKKQFISDPNHVNSETDLELCEHFQYLEVEKVMERNYIESNTELSHTKNIKKEIEIEENNNNNVVMFENANNDQFDEAELELHKLQRHLCDQSEQLESVEDNHPSAIQNDIKSLNALPYFSHPQLFNSSQPFNPHVRNSALIMKPSADLQACSTPKAYIHPTNRMTLQPTEAPPTSVNKHEQKMYECTHCDISFGDCAMYTVHMGYHSKQNPFQCNNCGVVSDNRVEFFLHMVRSSHE